MEIDINHFIERHFVAFPDDTQLIDRTSLRAFWEEIGPLTSSRIFEETVMAGSERSGELHARTSGWRVHLKRGLIKSALLTPFVAATLHAAGVNELSAILLPLVLPFLFEIERTKLSRKHEEVLLILISKGAARNAHTAEALYQLLPSEVRAQVNYIDFVEVIDALELLRLAEERGHRQWILHAPDMRLKITIE